MHALLFTDVVDSTKIVESVGDTEAARIWADHDRRARDLLHSHDGREIDRTDGFFLLFDDAAAAVCYALAYHDALVDLGLRARAGIHVGTVSLRANPAADVARGAKPIEVEGVAKPLAARIMALAQGGQTLLSAPAFGALGESTIEGAEIERHGFYRLKGIDAPVEIFEIGRRGVAGFVPPPDAEKAYQVVLIADRWQPIREVPHNLPAERDRFVGRSRELRNLARRLGGGDRLVTLIGPGGAGKTRLATHYAWAWIGDWPGGVYFCDLAESRTPDDIHYAVASALGIELGGSRPDDLIGHAIAGRARCLLILDNFEQVIGFAADTVGRWLDRTSDARFLATSRERLHLNGEVLIPVDSLQLADESVELFRARAAARLPDFALDASSRAVVAEIVAHLDGLPLAIELAAARVGVLSPPQLLKRLKDRFQLLAGSDGRSARQSTLRRAIDWSWDLLSTDEKLALAECAVFEGGFSLAAAETVLSRRDAAGGALAIDIVQALVEKSLLRAFVADESARYQVDEPYFGMYVSIREYARERLHDHGAEVESGAEWRHAEYFADLGSEDRLETFTLLQGAAARRSLELDFDNLVAACRRSIARRWPAQAVLAYRAAWEVLELRGPVTLALALGQDLLALPGLDGQLRLSALMTAAMPLHHAGRVEPARRLLEEALELARSVTAGPVEGRLLARLGALDLDQGLVEQAGSRLREALMLHRQAGDHDAEGATLGSLGNLAFDQGKLDEARPLYEQALALGSRSGNRRVEGSLLGNLGLLHFEQGHLPAALDHYERALAAHREIGSRRLEGIVLGNLGLLHAEQGDADAAAACYEEALAIHRAVGNRLDEGLVLGNLGELHQTRRDWAQAQDCFRAALAIARQTGYRRAEGGVLGALAELLAAQSKFNDARQALQSGEAILRELGDQLGLGKLLCIRAMVDIEVGEADRAQEAFIEAGALARAAGAGPGSDLGSRLVLLQDRLHTIGHTARIEWIRP